MKKTSLKKLKLTTATIQLLTSTDLKVVVGGASMGCSDDTACNIGSRVATCSCNFGCQ